MAHLLGSKNCLESLSRDIEDIQTTITDALEKVGPLRVQSWKFPDKLSSELDIVELTDTYSHSKDEDFNRLAHIVLFELVIDRFVFLLQASSQFLDSIAFSKSNLSASMNRPKSQTVGTTMSVGLVVKKFWSRVVQTSHNIQQMKYETKIKVQQISKMEETIITLREDNQLMRDTISSMRGRSSRADQTSSGKPSRSNANFILSPSSSITFRGGSELNDKQELTLSIEDAALSKVLQDVSTQTFDTAFVPCEACSRMQQNLLDVGASVISLCESQGLPSALAKQKKLLKQSLMAATDVSRWTNEQTRDIERINKHLDNLYAQIDPLKSDLDKSRSQNRILQEQTRELLNAKTVTELEIVRKENEYSKKIQAMTLENEASLKKMNAKLGELETARTNLQKVCKQLQNENASKKVEADQIVKENKRINQSLQLEIAETTRLKVVENEFHVLKEDLTFVRKKLYETEIELNKAQAENKAIAKHDKALQLKQESLLLRADQLDQECEDLQNRMQEMEEEQDRLKIEYESMRYEKEVTDEEVKKLKKIIEDSSGENRILETSIEELEAKVIQLKEDAGKSREQLRFISQFPVVGHENWRGDGTSENPLSGLLTSAGASAEMANIIEANNTRIAILEEQNDNLRKALESYEEFQFHKSTTIPKDRVPLWKSSEPNRHRQNNAKQVFQEEARLASKELQYGSKGKHSLKHSNNSSPRNEAPTNPKPPSHPRTMSSKLNEKRQAFAVGATLANTGRQSRGGILENRLNAAAQLQQNGPRDQIHSNDARFCKDESDWTETYSCPDCDKMYSNERDLQIHKSFCYAKS